MGTALLPAFTELVTIANTDLIPVLNEVIAEVGPVLGDALRETAPAFRDLVKSAAPLIPDMIRLAKEALPPLVELMKLAIPVVRFLTQGWTDFWSILRNTFGFLSGNKTLAQFSQSVDAVTGPLGALYRGARDAGIAVSDFIRGVAGQVGSLFSVGRDLFNGLVRGVQSVAGNLVNAVLAPVRAAVAGVKNFLGIQSPSKLMAELGGYMMQGLGIGWEKEGRHTRFDVPPVGGIDLVHRPSVGASVFGSSSAASAPAIYVQNPFTGEYLLAHVDSRADGRIRNYDQQQATILAMGHRTY